MAHFFQVHRRATFASSALRAPQTTAFVAALERLARTQGVPLLTFRKGQRKDDVMAESRAHLQGEEGILFIRKAQNRVTKRMPGRFRTRHGTTRHSDPCAWGARQVLAKGA